MIEATPEAFEKLIENLAKTPDDVASLLREISSEAVLIKPSAEEFSVLENICHLRDIEIEGYSTRIRRILSEEHPLLADIDGSRLAVERAYNQQNLNEALQAFSKARQQNVALLRSTNEEQLSRSGELEGVGKVTLGKLLLLMNEHDEGHLDELRMICRLVRSPVED
jgi:hypothetical protein